MWADHIVSAARNLGVDASMAAHHHSDDYEALMAAVASGETPPDLPVLIGQACAMMPTHRAYFVVAASQNLGHAITRLVTYQPVIDPDVAGLQYDSGGGNVTFDLAAPTDFATERISIKMVQWLETARRASAHHIVPTKVGMPAGDNPARRAALAAFFGCAIDHSKRFTIGFAAADLGRPFAYFEPSLWHSIKVDLDRALAMTRQEISLVDQVEKALTNMLPEGRSLLGDVAARLGIGPRTLQRRLHAQGVHYAALRDQVRLMLVKTYLGEQRLRKTEIAYLVGFRDPNSFFRRYRWWCETGQIDQKTDKLMDNL